MAGLVPILARTALAKDAIPVRYNWYCAFSNAVMAGLDPAIGYACQIASDVIPVSNHPLEMAGSNQ
jgi:hypothetical protein